MFIVFSEILYMVIGGYNFELGGHLADVELVSLDPDNNPVPPCLANLNDFPAEISNAAGSVDEGKVNTYSVWLIVFEFSL